MNERLRTPAIGFVAGVLSTFAIGQVTPLFRAKAGVDQVRTQGDWVGLDGRQSTSPIHPISYQWIQVAGPPVTIHQANEGTSYFELTHTALSRIGYVFQLTTTAGPYTDSDTINIFADPRVVEFVGNPQSLAEYQPPGGAPTRREWQHWFRRVALNAHADVIDVYDDGTIAQAYDTIFAQTTDSVIWSTALGFLKTPCTRPPDPRLYYPDATQGRVERALNYVMRRDDLDMIKWRLFLVFHDRFAASGASLPLARNHFRWMHVEMLLDHVKDADHSAFLKALVVDPMMMDFLDRLDSHKSQPNENLPRELLELFGLGLEQYQPGVDNYTEGDIKDISKVFTGWRMESSVNCVVLPVFDPSRHANVAINLFQNYPVGTGITDDDGVIAAIRDHPMGPRYIVKELFCEIVGFEADPSLVAVLAQELVNNQWNLQPVIRKIALSESLFSPEAYKAKVQTPIEFAIGAMRQLDMRMPRTAIQSRLDTMGQGVLRPPSVFGWEKGSAWIHEAAVVDRQEFIHALLEHNHGNTSVPDKLQVFRPAEPGLGDAASWIVSMTGTLGVDPSELNAELLHRWVDYLNTDAAGYRRLFDADDDAHLQERGLGSLFHAFTLSIGLFN